MAPNRPALKKKKEFMYDMYKISVDVTFTQMTAKKGITGHNERVKISMYKEYIKLEFMKLMEALEPNSLTKSRKKGSTASNKLDKRKKVRKNKS